MRTRVALLVPWISILALRLLAVTCSTSQFIEVASHPAGDRTNLVAIALIDADSIPDIVSANSSSLSVLLGTGDGGFGPPIVTNLSGPTALATGDFDGDTKTDVVIGYYGELYILLGHGDGTFEPPVGYSIGGGQITGIAVGTFDANASLDLAVVNGNGGGGGVSVLLGVGDGTFGAATFYPASGAQAITTGDFGGDGHLDLATANFSPGTVSLLVGMGDGTFLPATSFLAGVNVSGVAAADLDDDGNLDLLTTSEGFLSVLLGDGENHFEAALQYATRISAGQVGIGDFDGDGIPDAAAAAPGGGFFGTTGGVSILTGLGDGSFAPPQVYLSGQSSSGLAVGDLDGDGPDVVTADPDLSAVSVLLDRSDGTLIAAPLSPLEAVPNGNGSFAQEDFNGDGFQDFAWGSNANIDFVLGGPAGRFQNGLVLPNPNQQTINAVTGGVFVSGGLPDVIATDVFDVLRFPNLGGGFFGPPETILNASSLGIPAAGDFDQDGKLDLAVAVGCCPALSFNVFLGNGDGTFQAPVFSPYSFNSLTVLFEAELTGDTKIDIVAATDQGIVLLPGNGDGTFGASQTLSNDPGYSQAGHGDFNGDGHDDLLLTGSNANVALLLGNGDGTFNPPLLVGLSNGATRPAVADFDGDGNLDFAVFSVRLLLFSGLGNGHFRSPVAFVTPASAFFLTEGDFDGNGAPDVVVGSNQSLTTLLNTRLSAAVRDLSVVVGSPAILHASAAGFGTLTYQWRKGGVPLVDGGAISGSQTATLTIDPVAFADAGVYDVVVTDSCTNATSNGATLSVEFDDVPLSSPFHADILTIATAGIATGCTDTSYCPANPVSRAEMAVFLLKAKFGANHAPPPPPVIPIFPDVPADAFAAAWIDELATLNITGGCGDGSGGYCPNDPVTRGQMAVFLLKALLGAGYTPPNPAGIFADVPSDYFAIAWIEDLYNRNITAGCNTGPLRFCPDSTVPREQMATFLVRTFGL